MKGKRLVLFVLLVCMGIGLIWGVWSPHKSRLTVSFLDVGQGDAILIEGPTGIQLLVDGGRDRSVLRELGTLLSPFDRTLDVVLETHPDADHIGGLADVFEHYAVGMFITPGIENDTSASEALDRAVLSEADLHIVQARRGTRIDLGGGAYADILFPDREVRSVETNAGSVILRVVYGDTAVMLTGDAPVAVEEYVVSRGGELHADILKAGHHGSRTSTGEVLLQAVRPALVVISAGNDNSYGHPHEEVLTRIQDTGARVRSTAEEGTLVVVSDGKVFTEK